MKLHDLLDHHARQSPERALVELGDRTLTYAEGPRGLTRPRPSARGVGGPSRRTLRHPGAELPRVHLRPYRGVAGRRGPGPAQLPARAGGARLHRPGLRGPPGPRADGVRRRPRLGPGRARRRAPLDPARRRDRGRLDGVRRVARVRPSRRRAPPRGPGPARIPGTRGTCARCTRAARRATRRARSSPTHRSSPRSSSSPPRWDFRHGDRVLTVAPLYHVAAGITADRNDRAGWHDRAPRVVRSRSHGADPCPRSGSRGRRSYRP